MLRVLIQVEAGSREKHLYHEPTLAYKSSRQVSQPFPYPYGFMPGTHAQDGDCVDCYILTKQPLKAGSIVECDPVGLLEQKEGEELDYKVLAVLPGHPIKLNEALLVELRDFIYALFKPFPDVQIDIGRILPRQMALDYIQKAQEERMSKTPVVYQSTHRVKFSDLDPYNHMRTALYSAYYVDHRMECLREYVGWDLQTLAELPFMIWVRRMEIDFIRSVVGDQQITITSFVREFRAADAHIECTMTDENGRKVSTCMMIVAYVDKNTNRATDWPAETMALFFQKE